MAPNCEHAIKRWINHQMVYLIELSNPNQLPLGWTYREIGSRSIAHKFLCIGNWEMHLAICVVFYVGLADPANTPPIKMIWNATEMALNVEHFRKNGKKRPNEQQQKNDVRQNHIKHLSWANIERVFVCRGGSHWICIHRCIRGMV